MEKQLWFREICRKNKISLSDEQLEQFEKFVFHLLEWNKKINLIARTDEQNIWNRHILGSISFLFRLKVHQSSNIIDVGTGGGFPGIPLAILLPDVQFTLIDSIKKKINVVEDIIKQLQLINVKAICGRVEDLAKDAEFRQSYDYVVARAVAPMKDIIRWSKPLLKPVDDTSLSKDSINNNYVLPRGLMLLLKGGDLTQEIEEAKIKVKPRSIITHPTLIEGADFIDAIDKKLVIIQP